MQEALSSSEQRVHAALLARVDNDALRVPGNALVREELESVQRALVDVEMAIARLQEMAAKHEQERRRAGRSDSFLALVSSTEELQQCLLSSVERLVAPPR
ncbi:hypothetical protein Gpo141_00000459 [Globisporangium polare]